MTLTVSVAAPTWRVKLARLCCEATRVMPLKAGRARLKVVAAGSEAVHAIATVGTGLRVADGLPGGVGDGDGCVGDDRAGWIGDDAGDAGVLARSNCERRCGGEPCEAGPGRLSCAACQRGWGGRELNADGAALPLRGNRLPATASVVRDEERVCGVERERQAAPGGGGERGQAAGQRSLGCSGPELQTESGVARLQHERRVGDGYGLHGCAGGGCGSGRRGGRWRSGRRRNGHALDVILVQI